MNLTKTQKQKLMKHPDECPKCGSENICAEPFNTDIRIAWRKIFCNDCEMQWQENYELMDTSSVS